MATASFLAEATSNMNRLNYNTMVIGLLAVAMISCKATQYQFDSRMPLTDDSRKQITKALNIESSPIEQVQVYRAVLRERLVNENEVAEYTLRNTLSKKPAIDLEIDRYSHELYLYIFTVRLARTTSRYGLWLTTTRHRGLGYIKIGPAYLGKFGSKSGREYMLVEKRMKLSRSGNQVSFGKVINDVALRFYLEHAAEDPPQYRVTGIINEKPNKVSGLNKYLIYDIPEIFNDPDALAFTLIETIHP
jgi:hypothetical protein